MSCEPEDLDSMDVDWLLEGHTKGRPDATLLAVGYEAALDQFHAFTETTDELNGAPRHLFKGDAAAIVDAALATARPNPTLLAGISELADRYHVQANTVAVWTQRHQDFPKPLIQVGGRVRVWWVPDVDQWVKNRK